MLEITRGDPDVTQREQLTLDVRRDCDAEYLSRADAFIRRTAQAGEPFFVYFNHSLLHMPVIPREEFRGRSGHGDWADSLLELDSDFGRLLDLLDELGVADDTLVVFAGDNGPEEVLLCRGSPGYWEAPTSPAAKATCAPRASRAGRAGSRPIKSRTRSCTKSISFRRLPPRLAPTSCRKTGPSMA